MKLLLLPYEFYLLPLNRSYDMLKVYERLVEIKSIESWVTMQVLIDCILEYQQQKMGFELSEDYKKVTAVKPTKWRPYDKKYV